MVLQNFRVWKYLLLVIAYALLYQLALGNPLTEFGFGIPELFENYVAIPELGMNGISSKRAHDIYAAIVISSAAMTHYYFDSFIWTVSDVKTQKGL